MNQRKLLIFLAFLIPIILLIVLVRPQQSAPRGDSEIASIGKPKFNIEQMRKRTQKDLDKLNAMTDAQWQARLNQRGHPPKNPPTLAQARDRVQKHLDQLNKMTEADWEADYIARKAKAEARKKDREAGITNAPAPAPAAAPAPAPNTAAPAPAPATPAPANR